MDDPCEPRNIVPWDLFWREDQRVLLKPLQKKEVGLPVFSGVKLSQLSIFDRHHVNTMSSKIFVADVYVVDPIFGGHGSQTFKSFIRERRYGARSGAAYVHNPEICEPCRH
jgi:hypothetical protein